MGKAVNQACPIHFSLELTKEFFAERVFPRICIITALHWLFSISEGSTAIFLGESGVRERFELHLECTGAEANLTECFYLVVSIFSCYYYGYSDYGVKCPGKYTSIQISVKSFLSYVYIPLPILWLADADRTIYIFKLQPLSLDCDPGFHPCPAEETFECIQTDMDNDTDCVINEQVKNNEYKQSFPSDICLIYTGTIFIYPLPLKLA